MNAKKQKGSNGKAVTPPVSEHFSNSLPLLIADFRAYISGRYGLKEESIKRIEWMLDYNCTGGKFYRASIVLNTLKEVCKEKHLEYKVYEEHGTVLGWCVEILQACFLVADDIMDQSTTRRGKSCWYKQPTVKYDAVNDSFILKSFMYFLIRKYFGDNKEIYLKVLELFNSVSLDTEIGQMLDLTSQPQGKIGKDVLAGFSLGLYKKIVTYKTACYTFYLPMACGLIVAGGDGDQALATARDICMRLGEKFQIQDDYLDNFGAPETIGKIGTDIQDHKCSWLCVQALKLMSASQRETFETHYGQHEEKSVQIIKGIYNDLELEKLYLQQEETSHRDITKLINEASTLLPPFIFKVILDKIHLRQK